METEWGWGSGRTWRVVGRSGTEKGKGKREHEDQVRKTVKAKAKTERWDGDRGTEGE
jgi:hypothetical protein